MDSFYTSKNLEILHNESETNQFDKGVNVDDNHYVFGGLWKKEKTLRREERQKKTFTKRKTNTIVFYFFFLPFFLLFFLELL